MKELKEEDGYLMSQTPETRARLNDVRFQSKERSIYDPLSKKVPEIYDNMKSQNFEDEQHSGFDALKQLRGIYSDKEVINLLNTVSENKRKPFQTTLNHDTHDLL
jgi:hypothetical protein